jgi:hypothetical protein
MTCLPRLFGEMYWLYTYIQALLYSGTSCFASLAAVSSK